MVWTGWEGFLGFGFGDLVSAPNLHDFCGSIFHQTYQYLALSSPVVWPPGVQVDEWFGGCTAPSLSPITASTTLPVSTTLPAAGVWLQGFLEAGVRGVEPPSGAWIFSDVREVAAAHIAAATSPTASGRYIIAHNRQVVQRCCVHTRHKHGFLGGQTWGVSCDVCDM